MSYDYIINVMDKTGEVEPDSTATCLAEAINICKDKVEYGNYDYAEVVYDPENNQGDSKLVYFVGRKFPNYVKGY